MTKKICMAIFGLCLGMLCLAQTANQVGLNYTIDSEILDEERPIQVYTPPNYDSEKAYPVLYVLDGQRFFTYAVSLSQSLLHFRQSPEFIVVAISNSYPQRFGHFSDGRDDFLSFITDEVFDVVGQNYSVSEEKLLFGWEYGAGFAFNVMLEHPDLFDGYFLASPYPIDGAIDQLATVGDLHKTLVFGVSPDEYEINFSVSKLDSLLSTSQPTGLHWVNLPLTLEEHRSTGYPVLYHGLREYFRYFPELEVNNLQKFIEAGGMDYASSYSTNRSRLYGFEDSLSFWTRFTIVRSAMRADNFGQFEELCENVGGEAFVIEALEVRSYVLSHLAEFYEKYGRYQEAIKLYELLLSKYPDSERLLRLIIDAHEKTGNKKAVKAYQKRLE